MATVGVKGLTRPTMLSGAISDSSPLTAFLLARNRSDNENNVNFLQHQLSVTKRKAVKRSQSFPDINSLWRCKAPPPSLHKIEIKIKR